MTRKSKEALPGLPAVFKAFIPVFSPVKCDLVY